MADKTAIEWTEATWNPLAGCTHCSPGCDGCYAARDAAGRLSQTATYAGLATREPGQLPRFTGEVRLLEDRLDQPLRWRRPRRVFVNSMSDLFHPAVPTSFIVRVFVTMGLAEHHTFQVLTKRPQRMRLLGSTMFREAWFKARHARALMPDIQRAVNRGTLNLSVEWPLPNVWLGTSVESQRYADLRIPHLLQTPAAVRFLSCEPILGPIDLSPWLPILPGDESHPEWWYEPWLHPEEHPDLHWVIAGGESGPRARPMHPAWARQLRDQCTAAKVPFLFKQWGEWSPTGGVDEPRNHKLTQHRFRYESIRFQPDGTRYDPVGTGPVDGPAGYAGPDMESMLRVGKKGAGRHLDGRLWDEYPEPAR